MAACLRLGLAAGDAGGAAGDAGFAAPPTPLARLLAGAEAALSPAATAQSRTCWASQCPWLCAACAAGGQRQQQLLAPASSSARATGLQRLHAAIPHQQQPARVSHAPAEAVAPAEAAAAAAAGELCTLASCTTDAGAPVDLLRPSAASSEKCTSPGEGGSSRPCLQIMPGQGQTYRSTALQHAKCAVWIQAPEVPACRPHHGRAGLCSVLLGEILIP